MGIIEIFLCVVAVILGYKLWILWKTNDSCQAILEKLRSRIRSGLKVAGLNELEAVQENLYRLEEQVRIRLAPSKTSEKFSHQLPKCPKEIDPPFVHFEQSGDSIPARDVPFPRPRSIMWNGLRFTLSDSIWSHMGVMSRENNIEDDQVQAMVHGPFCRVCLKRLVGRDRLHAAEVPEQCRHCGLSWSNHNSDGLPVSLVELKRQVYDNLDRELRTRRRV